MMRIALLNIQYYPNVEGGAEISTQKLAEELAKNNDVFVICDGEYTGRYEDVNNVKIVRMPARIQYHNKVERVLTRCYKIQCYSILKKILLKINPDVLHTNNLHAFSVIVWKVASDLRIPIVHTLRDYTLLQTTRKYEQLIHRYFSNKVSVVTAPSQYTLNAFLKKRYFNGAVNRVAVPNAIDINGSELEAVYRQVNKKDNDTVVKFAFLGRYHKDKGVDWLISVFDKMHINAELHLYGKGELLYSSQKIIDSNPGIKNHGFLNEDQLSVELRDIDVIVAPSLWDEPFGRVILDGYKNLCPVIITNRGGMPEVIDDKATGLILPDETDRCLEDALSFLAIRENIKMMLPMVKDKIKKYTIEVQAETFIQLYKIAIQYRCGKA